MHSHIDTEGSAQTEEQENELDRLKREREEQIRQMVEERKAELAKLEQNEEEYVLLKSSHISIFFISKIFFWRLY